MALPRRGNEISARRPYRPLGRTGEMVSLVGLGGYHIGIRKDEQESIRIIREAIDNEPTGRQRVYGRPTGRDGLRDVRSLRDAEPTGRRF